MDNSIRRNFLSIQLQNRVLSPREGVHGPAYTHADQQEKEERPHDVFHALDGLPAAQEAERNGNHQREQQHRLQMTQAEPDRRPHAFRPRAASYACSAASTFNSPDAARKRVPLTPSARETSEPLVSRALATK